MNAWGWGMGRGGAVWAALLAVLTLALSVPLHVLDIDEDAPPAAAAATQGTALAAPAGAYVPLGHHAPGHCSAGHCAAHAFGDRPGTVSLRMPGRASVSWRQSPGAWRAADAAFPPDRPPRA